MVNTNITDDVPFLQDTILIVTDDKASSTEIRDHLDKKAYKVIISEFNGRTIRDIPTSIPTAVLINFKEHTNLCDKIVKILKEKFSDRNIPFIAALARESQNTSIFDTVIYPPAHPIQIANRVNSMVRLNLMQTEISLRIDTLKSEFGIDYNLTDFAIQDPFRVLFIGKATPEFMVIVNALQNKNVEVIGAFTSYSAFDFLHEHVFDAVVMNTLNNIEPGLTISETMRRNSQLYHVPTLFLINDTFADHDLAYEKGATDIISADGSEKEISGRILELANYHRIHRQLKKEFEKIGDGVCRDSDTQTYTRKFFMSHLEHSLTQYPTQGMPLSVITIKINEPDDTTISQAAVTKAHNEIGSTLRNMVRMQDSVGRLGQDTYAIIFPGQSSISINSVQKRISAVIDATGFEREISSRETFKLPIQTAIHEYDVDTGPKAFLEKITESVNTPEIVNFNPVNHNYSEERRQANKILAS